MLMILYVVAEKDNDNTLIYTSGDVLHSVCLPHITPDPPPGLLNMCNFLLSNQSTFSVIYV